MNCLFCNETIGDGVQRLLCTGCETENVMAGIVDYDYLRFLRRLQGKMVAKELSFEDAMKTIDGSKMENIKPKPIIHEIAESKPRYDDTVPEPTFEAPEIEEKAEPEETDSDIL